MQLSERLLGEVHNPGWRLPKEVRSQLAPPQAAAPAGEPTPADLLAELNRTKAKETRALKAQKTAAAEAERLRQLWEQADAKQQNAQAELVAAAAASEAAWTALQAAGGKAEGDK